MDFSKDNSVSTKAENISPKQMSLGIMLSDNYGVHPGAWRMPGVDVNGYTDIDIAIKYAKQAEDGGLEYIFVPDRAVLDADIAQGPPRFQMEPMMMLTAIATHTKRIGLIPSVSTSLTEPYQTARQLKALDVISHGRAGWNAIATNDPSAFANYGKQMPPRNEKYERLHETIQLVQALWGSWKCDADKPNKEGNFANPSDIHPISLQGRHVGAFGSLPIPPSEQGQPVIFQAGGGRLGLQAFARYADVVVGMGMTIEDSRAYRNAIREAVAEAGRNPDDVKLVIFVNFGLGNTIREALDRRKKLDAQVSEFYGINQLSSFLGVPIDRKDFDKPLPASLFENKRFSADPRTIKAIKLAKEGWSPRDLVAHGVTDYNPGVVGTQEDAADFLQEWFEAGAADGFILVVDSIEDGIQNFTDGVIPILKKKGLFGANEAKMTLRENLDIPFQYGVNDKIHR